MDEPRPNPLNNQGRNMTEQLVAIQHAYQRYQNVVRAVRVHHEAYRSAGGRDDEAMKLIIRKTLCITNQVVTYSENLRRGFDAMTQQLEALEEAVRNSEAALVPPMPDNVEMIWHHSGVADGSGAHVTGICHMAVPGIDLNRPPLEETMEEDTAAWRRSREDQHNSSWWDGRNTHGF